MSYSSRQAEGAGRAAGGGSWRDDDEGAYQQKVFNGKRMRKSVVRKTIDFNSSMVTYMKNRTFQRDQRYIPSPPSLMHDKCMHVAESHNTHLPAHALTKHLTRTYKHKPLCVRVRAFVSERAGIRHARPPSPSLPHTHTHTHTHSGTSFSSNPQQTTSGSSSRPPVCGIPPLTPTAPSTCPSRSTRNGTPFS